MEWHDLREVKEDNAEIRAEYKKYKRSRWYRPASDQPEHPYAKLVTAQCDNIILREDTYCEICGMKHGMYTLKRGWVPARPPKPDQGASGSNPVASGTNRFPRRMKGERVDEVVTHTANGTKKLVIHRGGHSLETGSDHSSDGTEVEELFTDDEWDVVPELVKAQEELEQAVQSFQKPVSQQARMTERERLMKLYPEIYAD